MHDHRNNGARLVRLGAAAVMAAGVLAGGCGGEGAKLEKIYLTATGGGGAEGLSARAAASNALREAWYEKRITLDRALTLAHEKVEAVGDTQSLTFAGAVLDVIETIEPDIDQSKLNEFFWIRVGTLAGAAAARAFNDDDMPLARSLMLGGTERWQNDAYWQRHTAHDALVAYVMFRSGEGPKALERLRSRPELDEETRRAYDEIEKAVRKARGG